LGFISAERRARQAFRSDLDYDKRATERLTGINAVMPKGQLNWKKKPEAEDYAGALNFLSLIYPDAKSQTLLRALRHAKTVERAVKDLLRASNLPLLPRDEPHVADDLKRVHKGKALAPVLLVQGEMNKGIPLIVADGYHRICAICYYDESAPVPCRMAVA
jgi:hypothetical protein